MNSDYLICRCGFPEPSQGIESHHVSTKRVNSARLGHAGELSLVNESQTWIVDKNHHAVSRVESKPILPNMNRSMKRVGLARLAGAFDWPRPSPQPLAAKSRCQLFAHLHPHHATFSVL